MFVFRPGAGKGTWRMEGLAGKHPILLVCCPTCGRDSTMSQRVHRISDTGTVTPSYVCPYRCTFHEMVMLEGWTAPDRRVV